MSTKHPRRGSAFDHFLKEDGLFEAANAAAMKQAFALKLEQQMAKRHLTKTALALRLGTSRAAVDRVLDGQNTSVTLNTLSRTAAAVGCRLKMDLLPA